MLCVCDNVDYPYHVCYTFYSHVLVHVIHYLIQLREFLERLWTDSHRHHPQLSNLCVRLDYNGFYSDHFSPDSGMGFAGGVDR